MLHSYGVTPRNRDSANLLESVYDGFALSWREIGGNPTNLSGTAIRED